MQENEIAQIIVQTVFDLHKSIEPGLLESVYKNSLAYDIREKGLIVETEVPIPFIYKEVKQDVGFRLDLLVEKKVILEIKAQELLAPVHYAQFLTYLKLINLKLGLLINFNVALIKENLFSYYYQSYSHNQEVHI
ncbi:MAG: GxxExxY protein [Melioribacteraceae bacterium]|nr:GxxExxY protein [Melioribacteraceae bacterium]